MDTQDVSHIPQYLEILKKQQQNLRNARSRKGQRMNHADPQDLIQTFLLRKAMSQLSPSVQHILRTSCVPPSYLPSVTPIQDLCKAKIRELLLETHHRGKYVMVRSLTVPDRMTAIMAIVEDEYGSGISLQLYHQEHESKRSVDDLIPQGSIVLVKEPYLKMMTDGSYGLRTDHPSDLVWLLPSDPKIPECWKQDKQDALLLKNETDCLLRAGKYYRSLDCYSQALCLPCEPHILQAIRLNRALAFLKTEQFNAVMLELEHLGESATLGEKALYRKAMALYGLSQYRLASKVLATLCASHPKNEEGRSALARSIARLKEETSGAYDFEQLRRECSVLDTPALDHATFRAKVEIRMTTSKGRGLFTTEPVQAGDLLFCEKAFAYAFADQRSGSSDTLILINTETERMSVGKQSELITEVTQKMYKNPALIQEITDLYHGSYKPTEVSEVDGLPIVDTFLVERIVALNVFGCPRLSQESHGVVEKESFGSCGLWTLASYINHSCCSNTRRAFLGNMMVVRATQDLDANTELTFWYQHPSNKSWNITQEKLNHWGFKCECQMCENAKITPSSTLHQRDMTRSSLTKLLNNEPIQEGKLKSALKALTQTYSRPAIEVPRFALWDVQLALAKMYASKNKHKEAATFAIASLQSLGYEIQEATTSTWGVARWGIMVDQLVECWLLLAVSFTFFEPTRVNAALQYARTTYRCCVGEDVSFETVYDKYLPR